MKRDLFTIKPDQHREQGRMATNIANLKDKQSKRQQAHLLCRSLIKMTRGK